MKIGDIDVPCVSAFDATDATRKTETIAPLGTDLHVIAEFDPEPVPVEISGTLFQEYGGNKTADEYAEDLAALASRKSVWNYVHDVQGQYGFIAADECNVDPHETTKARRDFNVSGIFLPLAKYQGKIEANPVIRSNSFGILLEACTAWVQIPRLSSYTTPGATRTLASEYGSLTQASDDVQFLPGGEMDGIGEVRVFDGTKRIFSAAHLVSGLLTFSNGLYKVTIDKSTDQITISYWSGEAYTKIDDFTLGAFTSLYLKTCRPDLVEVVLSSGAGVSLGAGVVPLVSESTMTCTTLTPDDQTTAIDNFLVLGEDLYVASDQALEITSGVISGNGKKWIFHADSDVSQEAKNCLVDLRAKWHVVRRW